MAASRAGDTLARPGRGRHTAEGVLLVPLFVVLLVVFGYPLVEVVRLGLYREQAAMDAGTGTFTTTSHFVGLGNVRYLLTEDPHFWEAVRHNVFFLLGLPIMLLVALVLAWAIFEGVRSPRLAGAFRSLVFLPYVLSSVVIGQVFGVFLRSDGPLNGGLGAVGLSTHVAWLGDPRWALPSVLGVIIWRELGLGVLLFLARLATTPEQLFEAARVEGASSYQLLRHIAIPQLRSTIAFWLLLNLIVMFSWVFNYVFVLTNGGPGSGTTVMELEIYRWATLRGQANIAAAMATMLLVLVASLVLLQAVVRRALRERT